MLALTIMKYENIIKYDECIEDCAEIAGFTGAEFLQDFGPWKKGEKVETMWFILDQGKAEEHTKDGKVIKSCKIGLCAL